VISQYKTVKIGWQCYNDVTSIELSLGHSHSPAVVQAVLKAGCRRHLSELVTCLLDFRMH
jgi:hypothetical protein